MSVPDVRGSEDVPGPHTDLPPQTEFTASNGLKVSTDVGGAVGVQWGSPRAGGWTFHDPDETRALQEFFAHHAMASDEALVASPRQSR